MDFLRLLPETMRRRYSARLSGASAAGNRYAALISRQPPSLFLAECVEGDDFPGLRGFVLGRLLLRLGLRRLGRRLRRARARRAGVIRLELKTEFARRVGEGGDRL